MFSKKTDGVPSWLPIFLKYPSQRAVISALVSNGSLATALQRVIPFGVTIISFLLTSM